MNGNPTYRQYLQYHANNHPSATKRAEAQALLNVVGDDTNLDGNFLVGSHLNLKGQVAGEQRSNGYTASTVNRTINPWWVNSYDKYRKANEGVPEPGNFPGASGGGDGGRVAADARERAATIGSYEDQIADIDNQLGNVSREAAGKRAEYEKGYLDARQGVLDNFNTANNTYNVQEKRTKKAYGDSLEQINSGASRNYRALMNLAGMYNAGRSAAAQTLIPQLVSQEASRSRAGVADKYGENMEDLTSARAALTASKDKSLKKLDEDKRAGLAGINDWERSRTEGLLREKGAAQGNLTLAKGGNWSRAREAMAGIRDRANALRSEVAGSKEQLYKGYKATPLEIKQVKDKNYAVDVRGVEKTEDGQGADSSTEAQYLEMLKKRRKEESAMAV